MCVEQTDRLAHGALYEAILTELRVMAMDGRPSKQAPRFLVTMLAALEELVVDTQAVTYLWLFS